MTVCDEVFESAVFPESFIGFYEEEGGSRVGNYFSIFEAICLDKCYGLLNLNCEWNRDTRSSCLCGSRDRRLLILRETCEAAGKG